MKKQTISLFMMTLAMSAPAFAFMGTNSPTHSETSLSGAKYAKQDFDTRDDAKAWLKKHISADEQADVLVFRERDSGVGNADFAVVVVFMGGDVLLLKNDFAGTVRVTDPESFRGATKTTQELQYKKTLDELKNNYRAVHPAD